MIPMVDMARILAERGVIITLVSTLNNASRFEQTVIRAAKSGIPIQLLQIPFPCQKVGLPLGCENLDTLPSRNLLRNFYIALEMTQEPLEKYLSLPDLDDFRHKMLEAEMSASGVVVNSFEELEHGCAKEYEKALNKRVWCIGPVSLSNKDGLDKFERGNKPSIEEKQCLEWLNSMEPRSVLYVCLGSLCRLVTSQLIELGLGLEASNQTFIWVVKTAGENLSELNNWLEDEKFDERVRGRGLVIKGWAPQTLILSHPSVGGFLTHCGWNSTIEGVCSGLPMITWPLFAEQFLNEKFIVQVLKIGVRIGVEVPVRWGDEEKVGAMVKKSRIMEAIEMCMLGGEEEEKRRNRAIELGKMARNAIVKGGSSHFNISCLIEDIMKH
ncbi:UDP-glycosyltransferase 73D1 [Glycine soja]|nr:UDP-glycosyltransferase 73D1 [Glycine soja]